MKYVHKRSIIGPVVGKWSVMDRGFGNFYGSVPGQLDAWSRIYMGWLEPVEITPGEYNIAPLGFDSPDAPQAYKIPVSNTEYFLPPYCCTGGGMVWPPLLTSPDF